MPSPFDRTGPKQSKPMGKFIAAGILAVALGGVLLLNRHGGAPRPADASVAKTQSVPTIAMPVPAEVLANLEHDPTANLLRNSPEGSDSTEKMPSNPFVLAPAWRSKLVKAEPIKPTMVIEPVAPKTSTPVVLPVSMDGIKVQGVVRDATHAYAIINGSLVRQGNVVAGARIVEITEEHILFQPVGGTESSRFEYPLKPKQPK